MLPRFGACRGRAIHRSAVKALLLELLDSGEGAQGIRPGREVKRTRKRLARGSVRSIYHTLSAILSEAVEDGLIVANPIRGLWKRLARGHKAEAPAAVKALDAGGASRFLAAARLEVPEHFPYLATLTLAGLRPGEGLALTLDVVDVAGRSLLVARRSGSTAA